MLRSWSSRGQTEPLAALIAVIVMVIAFGLYSGFLTDAVSDRSDRSSKEVAIDRVWEDVSHNGVFAPDRDSDLHDIEQESLPPGQNVHVEVTTIGDDGEDIVVDELHFGTDSTPANPQEGPPAEGSGIETSVTERPIPVEVQPGDVRGGTLRVEVWSS